MNYLIVNCLKKPIGSIERQEQLEVKMIEEELKSYWGAKTLDGKFYSFAV
jgi:hypothetical protein